MSQQFAWPGEKIDTKHSQNTIEKAIADTQPRSYAASATRGWKMYRRLKRAYEAHLRRVDR